MIAGSRYRTVFQKTYPMSTYLAAWAVLPEDFEFEEAMTQRGIKVSLLRFTFNILKVYIVEY